MALRACTIAYPMRCVKEIFPPRARFRWLLMTMRLSKSSFTGTARTDVAVGSSREAFMFFATAADGPRSVTYSGPAGASVEASAFAAAGAAGAAAAGAAGAADGAAGACAVAPLVAAGAGVTAPVGAGTGLSAVPDVPGL